MSLQRIEDLPGVGPQLATRIRARFPDDKEFFLAAQQKNLQAIATVEGVSSRRAVDLALAAGGHQTPDHFLATPAARKVHERLMERLLAYASTETGRNRLRLLHPLPTAEAANEHARQVMAAKAMATNLDPVQIKRNLRCLDLRPTTGSQQGEPGILVVAESNAVFERLHAWKISKWATMGTARDLANADGYDLVVVVYDEGQIDASSVEHAVEVSIDEGLAAICPSAIIQRFSSMRAAVDACVNLAELAGRPSVAPEIAGLLDGINNRKNTPSDLDSIVTQVKDELDQTLTERVAGQSLAGPELLAAVSTGKFPPSLQRIIDQVLDEGRQRLHQLTGLRLQPFLPGFPIQIDEGETARIHEQHRCASQVESFDRAQKVAKKLAALDVDLGDEISSWQEFDATFALGRFALDHDLQPALFGGGIEFQDSIHLDMATNPSAQRIAYQLGGDASVAILTGANSGGKSTLLEHLTQLVLMARLGLPVVGEDVMVPWLDEVHLVTARRGLDAGAFESFLRGFLPVTRGDARRLVLADEVEAVTELDAAGRILAWALGQLAQTESLAVVVTHLAEQVLHHMKDSPVRVDGIAATGLDDQHQLIVDRSPRMGQQARSTPELIIQRLAATTRGDDQLLFQDLLSAFGTP